MPELEIKNLTKDEVDDQIDVHGEKNVNVIPEPGGLFTVKISIPDSAPAPAPTTPGGGGGMNRWPKDNQDALIAFYGDPGTKACEAQLVPVVPPFLMTYEGKPIESIKFHKKAADALLAALNEIWEAYGKDQSKVDAAGVSRYDGAYNPRFIRGSTTKWSNHAYGAAIDINAQDNGFNTGHGTMPKIVVDAFKRQGARWGGDYRHRTDPMHFEFCDAGESVEIPAQSPADPAGIRPSILDLVARSPLVPFRWDDRGRAPIGYIKGMALMYARVVQKLLAKDPAAVEMAKPVGDGGRDALAWYGLDGTADLDRLRALFTLQIGLGMRESSGQFCEGWDREPIRDPLTPVSAEAGLFQMSWNITDSVPLIKTIFETYSNASLSEGLVEVFREGVNCTADQLEIFGTGPGADFQKMAKDRPAFAVEAAAVGLRNRRSAWGPITRKEAQVLPETDALLRQIEAVVTGRTFSGTGV
jgi:hypothetical protein